MAKFRKHKMFRRAPSKPRAPRPPPGPARAGFTYGYQWSAVQPPALLRFPIEDQGFKLYPVASKRNTVTHVTIERPDVAAYARWWTVTVDALRMGPRLTNVPELDFSRLAVALDWHQENGFDLNPYHLSGRSWGAVRFMRHQPSHLGPIEWMNELADFWRRIVHDGTQREWSKAPESLWWLDTELRNPDFWYDLRERLWPEYAEAQRLTDEIIEEENEPEPDEEPDIDGGDIVTEDYLRWYQYGRLYASGPDHASAENAVRARANAERFWPNLWVQDDHGGMTLIRGFRWH